MDKRVIFYLIDGDDQNTELLQKLISKVFPTMYVKKFNDGFTAWKSFEKEKLEVVFICEYDVTGINGLQIIKKLRSIEATKDTYFIMMSDGNDREILMKSVQAGVDDFIQRPFSLDQFLLKLKTTSRILNLNSRIDVLEKESEQLKKDFEPLTLRIRSIFEDIQKLRFPEKEQEIQRVISATNFIARQLTSDTEELREIDLAAKICYVPKAMFKDRFAELPVMVEGIMQNQAMNAYFNHIKVLFTGLKGFDNTIAILNGVYENFDGSGVPNKLKSWGIPLGSRILRAVMEFEYHYSRNPKKLELIIPMLWNEINRVYDFRILAFYDQYLGYLNTIKSELRRPTEVIVNPNLLAKGMVLSRNIITISGLKLLNAGTKLDDEAIKKIQEAKEAEAYIGLLFVKIESIPIPVVK